VGVPAHLAPEPKEVQAGLRRVSIDADLVFGSAFENGVVHLPELALRGRALGGLGRFLGVPELLGLGEASVDVTQTRAHLLLDLLDRPVRLRARRGSEVAVSHERGSGERGAARVVLRRHFPRESSVLSLTFHRDHPGPA